jgi:hypothetical protein
MWNYNTLAPTAFRSRTFESRKCAMTHLRVKNYATRDEEECMKMRRIVLIQWRRLHVLLLTEQCRELFIVL